jgi:hypothetical protein
MFGIAAAVRVKDWLRLTLRAAAEAVGVLLVLLVLPLTAVRLKLPPAAAAAELGEPAALATAADVRDLLEDLQRRGFAQSCNCLERATV